LAEFWDGLARIVANDPYTVAVFTVYALATILLPTLAPVSISDDWTYIRSVEYLVNRWEIHILPVAAATEITQLFWGGAFGLVFGARHWIESWRNGALSSAGTVMLSAITIIVGIQLLLAFLAYDIASIPRRPLHRRLGAGSHDEDGWPSRPG